MRWDFLCGLFKREDKAHKIFTLRKMLHDRRLSIYSVVTELRSAAQQRRKDYGPHDRTAAALEGRAEQIKRKTGYSGSLNEIDRAMQALLKGQTEEAEKVVKEPMPDFEEALRD